MANSRVTENRQTENLGDFDGFQPSRMRTFQILRFAEIEINPCNSTSNTGTKKAEWRVTIRHQSKKNGGGYLCESKLILRFCKSLITKHSHEDTRIEAKNSVLKQAKMVSTYHKIIPRTPKKSRNQQLRFLSKSLPFIKRFLRQRIK